MTDKLARVAATAAIATWSPEQRALIKATVTPADVSDDELSLFLHVAATMGLDPLRKQIHCMKVKGRLVFVADVNGLQARAAKAPDYRGLLHAVVYEKDDFLVDNTTGQVLKHATNPFGLNGKIVGAWATVSRKGKLPFTAIVRFVEYDSPYNDLWKTKPSVMIDKVAKSTALRLAYPEQFGGVYDPAEMDKEEKELNPPPEAEVSGQIEAKRRLAAKTAALRTAPEPAPAPAPTAEPVAADSDEGEEIITATQRFFRLAPKHKLSTLQLAAKAKEVTGKDGGFSHAEIDALEKALGPVTK